MEWNHLSPTCKTRPPADKVRADMTIFLAEMEAFYGKRPVIYTTVDFHRDVLHGDALGHHTFWVRSVASHPSAKYGDRNWTFWQYTATGSVPGVRGKVDRNVFAGNEDQWRRFLSQGGVAVAAAPAPVPAAPVLANVEPQLMQTTALAPPAPEVVPPVEVPAGSDTSTEIY